MRTKKVAVLTLFIILTFCFCISLSGCSDIVYPPRPQEVPPPVTDTPMITENPPVTDKYSIRRYDLLSKAFAWSSDVSWIINDETLPYAKFMVSVEFNAPQHYQVGITAKGSGVVAVSSDEEVFGAFYVDFSGDFINPEKEYEEYFISPVFFAEGESRINFTAVRGDMEIVKITVGDSPAVSADRFEITSLLNYPDPSLQAAIVFDYLKSRYGGRALTAQYCTVGSDYEIGIVADITGREPAVRIAEISASFVSKETGEIEVPEEILREFDALESWWEKGGIPALTWLPERGKSEEDFLLYADKMAVALLELSRKNIPVLWNPMPDGGSGLYWWGKLGGEEYIRLWNELHDKFTGYGLDNLIWVWSAGDFNYYPGDRKADIVGENVFSDILTEVGAGSQAVRLASGNPAKMMMVSASPVPPSPDLLARDNAGWLIWSLYNSDFADLTDSFAESLDLFYNHELTVCLDGLPDFRG
ncbi:MAG: glycoside hydrolase family 26 protein [Oscillospiraceae bacterium]|nr:glycoside hydrolase family 26 protein [Oscillospiraceae bacterium]